MDQRRVRGWYCGTLQVYPLRRPGTVKLEIVPDLDVNNLRPRSHHLHALSLSSIGLCIVLWIRAKTIGEDERDNAERRALFVGLWPPMFWLIGDTLRRSEGRGVRISAGKRLLRR